MRKNNLFQRVTELKKKYEGKLFFPFIGLLALIWFLIRVIPKPSRAAYPCQRVAFPIASGFVIWMTGILSSVFLFKKAGLWFRKSRYLAGVMFIFLAITVFLITDYSAGIKNSYAIINEDDDYFVPTDSVNSPVGEARGINPGRVVWAYDPDAANWDGSSYWWKDEYNDQSVVDEMFSSSMRKLTGTNDDVKAWDTLFHFFNVKHGRGNKGYQGGEKIAIKLNLNKCGDVKTGRRTAFTSPHVVLSLTRQLVNIAGVNEEDITYYDVNRMVPDQIFDKVKDEFPGIHFMGVKEKDGREKYVRDLESLIEWSEELTLEIGGGHDTYLPLQVTEATYFINLANFRGHRYAGVTFGSKNHFGSISNDNDEGNPSGTAPKSAGLHPYMTVHDFIIDGSPKWSFYQRDMGTYNSIVDIMGHKHLGGKTLLYIIDALYGTPTEQDDVTKQCKWLTPPFDNDWTSSMFMSQDAMAIESVGLDFYRNEQQINENVYCVYGTVDNYLHEGAMANDPPSGTFYDPEGDGTRMPSMGVHEHWNNPVDKQYTRNLGIGDGIELVQISAQLTAPTGLTYTLNPDNSVLLEWEDNEDNEDSYLIMRSDNNNYTFEIIATLDADVSSYTDNTPEEGNIYFYRIRAVNENEYSNYSNVVELDLTVSGIYDDALNKALNIFPNPFKDILNIDIQGNLNTTLTIEIVTITGQKVWQDRYYVNGMSHGKTLNMKDLLPGTYILHLKTAKNEVSRVLYKK